MGAGTKAPKSRQTVALPEFVIEILTEHQEQQQKTRADRGWKCEGIVYVFGTRYNTAQQAQVIRDQFRAAIRKAGIPGSWTPRELRHSFVSLMSDSGASEELIPDLVGHANTTTRAIYRHQPRSVITKGAEILDGAVPRRRMTAPNGSFRPSAV
ncbi:tyrosine-type recombinase/integrase [Glycomyces sp. A-F 0318]|uniref:tyrosine-type recombinase/integrase n=1 Tax=Glycomyces amatae TaxID=2881355 RepID=UPI001E328849|nr:tyrosine-type recombinase/integrase [Glycomyces amatae]MCD0447001.1 tyrosine-type recombinase/integrase [Glycomyces amatae]